MNPALSPLPGQSLFADPARSREVVRRTFEKPGGRILEVSAVLRRGLPGRRSAHEIELSIVPDGSSRPERRRVLGKVFCKEEGARAFEVLRDLRKRGFSGGPCRVPKPLGYDPGSRLLLLEWVEGRLLRDAVLDDLTATAAVERAAGWLARLHRCGTATGRPYTFERHLHTLTGWANRIGELCPAVRPRLLHLLSWIGERGKAMSGWTPGPTHRDFSPDHLLISGPVLTGLDFDEFCQYDRLFDVAHFVAHLRRLEAGARGQLDKLARAFCAAYRVLAPEYSEARLAVYTAISYFKLAHIVAAVTRPADWEDRVVLLLNAAHRAEKEFPCD